MKLKSKQAKQDMDIITGVLCFGIVCCLIMMYYYAVVEFRPGVASLSFLFLLGGMKLLVLFRREFWKDIKRFEKEEKKRKKKKKLKKKKSNFDFDAWRRKRWDFSDN